MTTTAQGATLVTPDPSFATIEGGQSNIFPIGSSASSIPIYQQVFGSSLFTQGPILISSFAFRANGGESPSVVQSINLASLQVIMSTTSAAVDSLSTTFASNLGGDQTVVINSVSGFSQPTTLTKSNGLTYDFDYVFTFSTPFLYDPSQGNLIFEIDNTYGSGSWFRQFDALISSTDQTSRAFQGSTSNADTFGLVVQFTYTTPTPEPEMLSLLFGSLLGLGALRLASSRRK